MQLNWQESLVKPLKLLGLCAFNLKIFNFPFQGKKEYHIKSTFIWRAQSKILPSAVFESLINFIFSLTFFFFSVFLSFPFFSFPPFFYSQERSLSICVYMCIYIFRLYIFVLIYSRSVFLEERWKKTWKFIFALHFLSNNTYFLRFSSMSSNLL